jgi:ABC-2 type transport system ATP-binding protein
VTETQLVGPEVVSTSATRGVSSIMKRETVVLNVQGLRMRYGTTDVLHDVTFQARHGEVLVLLAPDGAGRTTTIEILEGFRMRSAGRVRVLGTDPAHGDERWPAA